MIDFKKHNNFYVITAGKTTLLNALKGRYKEVIHEIIRKLIKEQPNE